MQYRNGLLSRRAVKMLIPITIVLVTINSYIVCKAPEHFEFLPLLSIIASLSLLIFLLPEYVNHKSSTILLLSLCISLKYIITPLFYCIDPISSFSRYTPQDMAHINLGILLMIYELIAVTLSTFFFSRRDYLRNTSKLDGIEQRDAILSSRNTVVFLFVVFAFFVYFAFPVSRNGLSFMALKANTGVRVSSIESSSLGVLLREIVLIGFYSTFILISVSCSRKYMRKRQWGYLVVALFSSLFVTAIIVSEARSSQIYCGYACIVLLGVLFPEKKKTIQRILIAAIIGIVLVLTVYKTFYAFKYTSYSEALSAATIGTSTLTYNLETYCLGPLHYTAIVELGFWNGTFTFSRLVFGLLRTVMGTNMLVKNINMNTTSMVFNEFVTGNTMNTGYLLPITGIGYFYFSPILAPLITCGVYRIASGLEFRMKRAKSSFSLFFMAYVYIRVATCIVATNINTILSMSSMILLTAGLIALVNKRIKI